MESIESKNLRNSSFINDNDGRSDYNMTREMRSDVIELKSSLKHIQKEQTTFAITLGNADDAVREIWRKIKVFDSTLPSLAASSSLHALKLEVDQLTARVAENQEYFRRSITEKINNQLDQIYDWFAKLENSVQSRQQQINCQIEAFARECDLSALRENVGDDFIHFQLRMDSLNKSVVVHDKFIRLIKFQIWAKTFLTLSMRRKALSIKDSWVDWRNMTLCWRHMNEMQIAKAKILRKLIQKTCFGAKQHAWDSWQRLIHCQRSLQKKRSEASFLVYRALQRYYSMTSKTAFLHWRRFSVLGYRVSVSRFSDIVNTEQMNEHDEYRRNEVEDSLRLRLAVSTLKHDNEGALLALTNELCHIRSIDIVNIWEEMRKSDESLEKHFDVTLESIKLHFQGLIATTNDVISNQSIKTEHTFVEVKAHIQTMIDRIYVQIDEVFQLGMKHSEKIDSIVHTMDDCTSRGKSADWNLERIKETLNNFDEKNRKLEEANRQLEKRLSDAEDGAMVMATQFEKGIKILEKKVDALLKLSSDHTSKLGLTEDVLCSIKHDQMQVRMNMDERFDRLTHAMNDYGVRKPNIDTIINDCISYETVSKERNYTVAISRINSRGVEIDLSDHIASFAHDYAGWIAFQVDHEVLQCIIIGRNPDDLVYANDEISEKRTFLLMKLRARLETTLDEASPGAGSQRLEARTKFISRVIDATEAALSRFDQVLVPMSARLSKVKATVPTCMACDRPLRIKERSGASTGAKVSASRGSAVSVKNDRESNMDTMEGKATALSCILSNAVAPSSECPVESNFVMRGGFRMPLSGNRSSSAAV
jgi:hypothetical protein